MISNSLNVCYRSGLWKSKLAITFENHTQSTGASTLVFARRFCTVRANPEKREVSEAEAESKTENFHKASKEVRQQIHLPDKWQIFFLIPTSMLRTDCYYGCDRDVWYTFLVSTASCSQCFAFLCLKAGNRGQFHKMKKKKS